MKIDLGGMAIIITGAANGIGRAIALQAAEAGAEALFLTDRDGAGLADTAAAIRPGTKVSTAAADLTGATAAREIVDAALSAFGRIDGLVNSAGLTTRGGFLDGTVETWDRLYALNARAPFLLMQGVISHLVDRKVPGVIVNIQSMNAHCGAPDLAIYASTKGALQTLTKNAANAHLADRIRVNGINLGWTVTPSEDRLQSGVLGAGADWAERAGAERPLGRLLSPEEAARLAVYLLSPASAPLTGVSIDLEQDVVGAPR